MHIRNSVVALAAAITLTMAGCASGGTETPAGSASEAASAPADVVKIKVGASPVPHAQILQYVQDNLAKDAGLDIEIVEFQDYVLPNTALDEKEIDANYFQHKPYLEAQIAEFGYKFTATAGVHIEPLGIYSSKVKTIAETPDGGKVGITNDPSNQGRGLQLLAANGLITLKDTGDKDPTTLDIDKNDKNLEFVELPAEQLARSLEDVDLAVINGNYALEADLKPSEDALALESGVDNPYTNYLVVRTEDESRPELVKLGELLTSKEVYEFIKTTWPDGEVIPAFEG
ncbi:MAG: MetQ/NlpA family ABC transporter substrate-binding protein [Propionibacteriaceae bacterium]|jgi:D-methionine transport system substrate-binding protein|nr:MetQ/NlpA family ABC transporter substrate-binding protein [Propionibacteriaceae bacterium]